MFATLEKSRKQYIQQLASNLGLNGYILVLVVGVFTNE